MEKMAMILFGSALAVLLFQLWNPQRFMIHWVSLFVLLNLGVIALQDIFYGNWVLGFQIFAAVGLIVTYAIRFRAKDGKRVIDYIKWFGILMIIGFPLLQTVTGRSYFDDIFFVIGLATFAIYIYDRWVFRPDRMTGRFRVILLCQTVLIFMMLIYALVQRTAALRSETQAWEATRRAEDAARMNAEEMKRMHEEMERLREKLKE